jgi:hypothetical protein
MTKEEERLASEEARVRAAEAAQKKYLILHHFLLYLFLHNEKPCYNFCLFIMFLYIMNIAFIHVTFL